MRNLAVTEVPSPSGNVAGQIFDKLIQAYALYAPRKFPHPLLEPAQSFWRNTTLRRNSGRKTSRLHRAPAELPPRPGLVRSPKKPILYMRILLESIKGGFK